jgi:PAS domain S-box-containing protein
MSRVSRTSFGFKAAVLFKEALDLGFMAVPLMVVLYLHFFQVPSLVFPHFLFHEVAIGLSIALSLFAAWVAWRCYLDSGEPALRWITLAFAGFAVVYAPHGALTHHSLVDLWLFILFGPASRVVMCGFLLVALLRLDGAPETDRRAVGKWLPWLVLPVVADGLVWVLAASPIAGQYGVRLVQESATILMSAAGILLIRFSRHRSPMMWLYQLALASFATSAFAFLLDTAWTHLWWLAHAVFAFGFFALTYGVARALTSNRSITQVYTPEQMMAKMAAANAVAQEARRSADRLKALFDASPIGIAVTDRQGVVVYCNDRLAEMTSRGADAIVGQAEREMFADGALRDATAEKAWESGASATAELAHDVAGGSRRWLSVTWTPVVFDGAAGLVAWIVDVTDRRRAATALEQAKHAAEVANRSKTEFLAAMSHELRTPLNAINGFAEVMVAGILGPMGNPRYAEYARHIMDSGQHLTALINDILDVSAIESGQVRLHESDVDLRLVIEAAQVMVADRARKGGLELRLDLADALPMVRGDERRLKQVVLNLLSNAVKFTPEGGKVVVTARGDPHGVMVSIADTGIGIRREDWEKALAPFSQVDTSLERQFEGLGLGLSMADRLTRLHGGTLTLDSEVGKGTTVTLRFPVRRMASTG